MSDQNNSMLQEIVVKQGIVMRPFVIEDTERIFEMLEADPKIRANVTLFANCHTISDVGAVLTDQIASGAMSYGIVKDGWLIGYAGIWQEPSVEDVAQYNISYFLDSEARGQGVVTLALRQLLIAAEKNLKVDRFSAWSEEGNEASARVLMNLGFTSAGEPYQNTRGQIVWDYIREVRR